MRDIEALDSADLVRHNAPAIVKMMTVAISMAKA